MNKPSCLLGPFTHHNNKTNVLPQLPMLPKFFFDKHVPGRGPEQRESGKTVLYPLIIINILISYFLIHYY
jgi:hypothetical protein